MRRMLVALSIVLITGSALADQAQDLGRIVVTPSRLAEYYRRAQRSVTSLDDKALEVSAWDNVVDRMGDVSAIDLRRRGVDGVQADLGIRGATLDQNTVLIDGIALNDPQTGHFNLDLPLTSADIERVEIVKGPVSSLYGPNSFGGAVNIITRKAGGVSAQAHASGGTFDYVGGGASVSYPAGPIQNRVSYEQSRSSGYRPQTWFDVMSFSDAASVETPLGTYDFLFGWLKKDFGAANFYSNMFQNEAEAVDTRFFKVSGAAQAGALKIEPNLFLRRHWDKFRLDTNRPGWQTNYSTTYIYGGGADITLENDFLDCAYGFSVSRDTMDSTNMQTHARTSNSVYIEISPRLSKDIDLNAGIRQDYFSDFGLQYSPSVSASARLCEQASARGAIGRSYRIPTFTDLYYADRANIGNPNLDPESSWTYEAGIDYKYSLLECSVTYFNRQNSSTIDWTRTSNQAPWRSSNIGSASANGCEVTLNIMPRKIFSDFPLERAYIEYAALDIYSKHDYFSKYALDYLKQQISAGAVMKAAAVTNSWVVNYKKRVGQDGYVVADTKFSYDLARPGRMACEVYLEITNLFNMPYCEQSGVSMPGRWIRSGVKMRF